MNPNNGNSQETVLIIGDEAEFARTVVARWQTERSVPTFTLVSTELCNGALAAPYSIAIVAPARGARLEHVLNALESGNAPTICVVSDATSLEVRHQHPRVLMLRQHEGWVDALVLVAITALRQAEAFARVQRAEQQAAAGQRYATLGRFMLEMRHSINNALTSILGNAELLLLEPGEHSAASLYQIQTIHNMAMRLHEMQQRFGSMASEMEFAEKESQSEGGEQHHLFVSGISR